MAKITLNGTEVTADEGAPLLEVIKEQGIFISNLCYIDGLAPYAGCRTCLVEVEGARGLQLSCTTKVQENMVVNTNTTDVEQARRQVMSIIMANHSDRCLTCHRTVHCRPGDICLRDDIVTHRCLTCSKNYRCELQTTTELVQMAKFEPWVAESRTYYEMPEQLPADRGNPYVEFDPQMCIICTRCVRACDELRHTNAITLAGRGFTTQIAFGAGGAIHESSCDFCGTCIDVCPVAALMEHPNKWIGQTNVWTETACGACSVGCTIKLGTRSGKGVIVRPDAAGNPVSGTQICVRGRFGYDALKSRDRIQRPTVRQGLVQQPLPWDQAIDAVAGRLAQVRRDHGPSAIAFLGSPLATNEENYLLSKIARAAIGTNNVDSSIGPVAEAVGGVLRAAFGSEVLTADLLGLAQSDIVLTVGIDIEQSHPVAVASGEGRRSHNGARLISVSPVWGELDDFATVRVEPAPGGSAAALAALVARLLADTTIAGRTGGLGGTPELTAAESGAAATALDEAAALLTEAALNADLKLSIVYAPGHLDSAQAAEETRALANLAMLCREGAAPAALHVLGAEANVVGMRDVGLAPGLLPGYRRADSGPDRSALGEIWHADPPAEAGLSFDDALAAAKDGRLKALVVLRDNPMMLAPDTAAVEAALQALDYIVVIDEVATDTAKHAHALLPDVSIYGRDGTITTAGPPHRDAARGRRAPGRSAASVAHPGGVGRGALRAAQRRRCLVQLRERLPMSWTRSRSSCRCTRARTTTISSRAAVSTSLKARAPRASCSRCGPPHRRRRHRRWRSSPGGRSSPATTRPRSTRRRPTSSTARSSSSSTPTTRRRSARPTATKFASPATAASSASASATTSAYGQARPSCRCTTTAGPCSVSCGAMARRRQASGCSPGSRPEADSDRRPPAIATPRFERAMTMLTDVPLFPLNTVLFPGMSLPLNIFEERYKVMIARCLEEQIEFGVVLIREGEQVGDDRVVPARGGDAGAHRAIAAGSRRRVSVARGRHTPLPHPLALAPAPIPFGRRRDIRAGGERRRPAAARDTRHRRHRGDPLRRVLPAHTEHRRAVAGDARAAR